MFDEFLLKVEICAFVDVCASIRGHTHVRVRIRVCICSGLRTLHCGDNDMFLKLLRRISS